MTVPVRGSIRLDRNSRWLEEISRRIIALEKASGGAASVTPTFASPATPAFGSGSSGGSSTTIVTGATDHGALTGLGDDDHPFYLEFLEPAVPRPHVHGPDDVLLLDQRFYRRGEQAHPAPHDHHHSTLPGLESVDHPLYQRKHGFEVASDGSAKVTITYSAGDRKITLTPVSGSFKFWIDGVKFEKFSAQVSGAHANSTGKHFFYYDATGTLQVSTSAWSIVNRAVTPVAVVYYYLPLLDGICFYECHTADRTLEQHYRDHFSQGARYISGFDLSGYTPLTDSDAGVTFAVASGTIADEDIRRTLSAVADGGPYCGFYRTGAAGDWTFDDTLTLPFFASSTYPDYNNPNGGGAGIWSLTMTPANDYAVYYLCAIPSVQTARQVILIPAQASYATLTAAQASNIGSLSWGTLPFEELAPLYKIIYRTNAGYGGTKKCRIEEVSAIKNSSVTVTGATGVTDHGLLTGLEDDDHPQYVFMARIFGG